VIRYPVKGEFECEYYDKTYAMARDNKEQYFDEQAKAVEWHRPYHKVTICLFNRQIIDSSSAPLYKWYPDGLINITHNALDRHVAAGNPFLFKIKAMEKTSLSSTTQST